MQAFISKYGLAAHLALLAVTPLFLSAFCCPATVAVTVMWLTFAAAIWLLMEPSRRATERLHEARLRVRHAIVTDPLFWLSLLVLIVAAIRLFNTGVMKVYDFELAKWRLQSPSLNSLPGSAAGEGLLPFAVVLALVVLFQGCRQALGKSARIAFASMVSIFGAVAAVMMVIACRIGFVGARVLSGASTYLDGDGVVTWSWSAGADSSLFVSSPGNAFGLCLLAGIVGAAGLFECKWNRLLLLYSFAIGGNFVGLYYFASPLVMTVYLALALLLVLFCTVYLLTALRGSMALRYVVTVLISGVMPALMMICVAPEEMTAAHGGLFVGDRSFTDVLFPEGFAARRAALAAYASNFWHESPWVGRGLGSFPLDLWLSGASQGEASLVSTGALNGWRTLLAERGLLGLGLVLLPVAFMVFTYVHRLICALGRHVFLPLAALGPVAVGATAALATVDGSFLRADSLMIAGVLLAVAGAAFPVVIKKPTESVDPS